MKSWQSHNRMTDSSTTTAPILDLIAGGCWARRQLRGGIKDVSVALKPMKLLTIMVGVVFIGPLELQELDVRFLHDHQADSGSDCGGLMALMPASHSYKTLPLAIFIHEVTGSRAGVKLPLGVESPVKVESRVGQGLHMSIMIGPVY